MNSNGQQQPRGWFANHFHASQHQLQQHPFAGSNAANARLIRRQPQQQQFVGSDDVRDATAVPSIPRGIANDRTNPELVRYYDSLSRAWSERATRAGATLRASSGGTMIARRKEELARERVRAYQYARNSFALARYHATLSRGVQPGEARPESPPPLPLPCRGEEFDIFGVQMIPPPPTKLPPPPVSKGSGDSDRSAPGAKRTGPIGWYGPFLVPPPPPFPPPPPPSLLPPPQTDPPPMEPPASAKSSDSAVGSVIAGGTDRAPVADPDPLENYDICAAAAAAAASAPAAFAAAGRKAANASTSGGTAAIESVAGEKRPGWGRAVANDDAEKENIVNCLGTAARASGGSNSRGRSDEDRPRERSCAGSSRESVDSEPHECALEAVSSTRLEPAMEKHPEKKKKDLWPGGGTKPTTGVTMQTTGDIVSFKCPACDERFPTRERLDLHIIFETNSHHEKYRRDQRSWTMGSELDHTSAVDEADHTGQGQKLRQTDQPSVAKRCLAVSKQVDPASSGSALVLQTENGKLALFACAGGTEQAMERSEQTDSAAAGTSTGVNALGVLNSLSGEAKDARTDPPEWLQKNDKKRKAEAAAETSGNPKQPNLPKKQRKVQTKKDIVDKQKKSLIHWVKLWSGNAEYVVERARTTVCHLKKWQPKQFRFPCPVPHCQERFPSREVCPYSPIC